MRDFRSESTCVYKSDILLKRILFKEVLTVDMHMYDDVHVQ